MTQEQKLKKIIQKAVEKGWDEKDHREWHVELPQRLMQDVDTFVNPETAVMLHFAPVVLFDQSFAKAVWGEDDKNWYCNCEEIYPRGHDRDCPMSSQNNGDSIFQYHLQQAVISDNPVDYYMEHLDG